MPDDAFFDYTALPIFDEVQKPFKDRECFNTSGGPGFKVRSALLPDPSRR